MGRWDTIADDLLTAATGAGVSVDRSFVAAGPSFAHTCRMIVVHLADTREVGLGESDFGPYASVTRLGYVVTFVADCMPTITDTGDAPPAAEITAAAMGLLADAEQIHDALLAPAFSAGAGITCQNVTVGVGEPFGPSGGKAGMRWPVAVVLT